MTKTALLLLGVSFLAGCGGSDADATEQGADSEGALRAGQLVSGVTAVEITITPVASQQIKKTTVTIALPTKVSKVMSGLKKRASYEGIPRCMPSYTTSLRFLDDHAKEIASSSITCGGGTLKIEGKEDVGIKSSEDLLALANAPLVPGDALWAIDEVDVTKMAGQVKKKVTDDDDVAKLVKAIKANQEIDPNASMPRCMPSHTIEFKRGGKSAASAAFLCGSVPEADVKGSFSIPSATDEDELAAHGGIRLDARPFMALFPSE